jgi:hypothetical protein
METSKQATDAYGATEKERSRWAGQIKWKWVEATNWTETMLEALEGVKGGKWNKRFLINSSQITALSKWKTSKGNI